MGKDTKKHTLPHPTVTDQCPTLQSTLTGTFASSTCRWFSIGSLLPTMQEAPQGKRASEKASGGLA